jgi:hypothetical protein
MDNTARDDPMPRSGDQAERKGLSGPEWVVAHVAVTACTLSLWAAVQPAVVRLAVQVWASLSAGP